MKFISNVKIFIRSGDGGNGCISRHRDKLHPQGVADGGNGGKGGDIYFQGSTHFNNLYHLKLKPHHKAKRGTHASSKHKNGKNGDDIVIPVPLGTQIFCSVTGALLSEILTTKKNLLFIGGKGGMGNFSYKTRDKEKQLQASIGKQGQDVEIRLNLKIIADIGLIGLPNAGKSSYISTITNSGSKVADYPFSTLHPNLGVVKNEYYSSLLIADIPGIVEDASQGKGLGNEFLKHIQRTKILVFLIDLSDNEEPIITFKKLQKELNNYDKNLLQKQRFVLLTKHDVNTREIPSILKQFQKENINALPISVKSYFGIKESIDALFVLAKDSLGIERITHNNTY